MAKAIYIYSKTKLPESVTGRLQHICRVLSPDNITARKPRINVTEKIAYAVVNPADTIKSNEASLLLGMTFCEGENWSVPGTGHPDGTYAIFRGADDVCEIVSDDVGSRTIWYYKDESLFISSTSQRAIIILLNSFDFNLATISWMLSTGSLGPDQSWDSRIKMVPARSSAILNAEEWTLTIRRNEIEFSGGSGTKTTYKKQLASSLTSTFSKLSLDFNKWVLTLSGGYDSRGILHFLSATGKDIRNLRTVTWGLKSSSAIKGKDAFVAKRLSEAFGTNHVYFHTDLPDKPAAEIVNRFLHIGEGRIDHIAGYTDGFEIWKTLFENEVHGIIRGDEGFGWKEVKTDLDVREVLGCTLLSDYKFFDNFPELNFPSQSLPEWMVKRENENMENWRDRLYHEYRIPVFLSALSDLKLSYVELINPLLSKSILNVVRTLPHELRTDKALFKVVVNDSKIPLPYSKGSVNPSLDNILKHPSFVALISEELTSNEAREIFPHEFLNTVLSGIEKRSKRLLPQRSPSFLVKVKSKVRKLLKGDRSRKKKIEFNLDPNTIAFRIVIITKMKRLLQNDSITH